LDKGRIDAQFVEEVQGRDQGTAGGRVARRGDASRGRVRWGPGGTGGQRL